MGFNGVHEGLTGSNSGFGLGQIFTNQCYVRYCCELDDMEYAFGRVGTDSQ